MSELALLDAALDYAGRGWCVIPLHNLKDGHCSCKDGERCTTPGKHPRLGKWPERASCDPKLIGGWWSHWPNANVGVLTGKRSRIIVLDVDPRHGGDESLAAFEAEHGKLPATPIALTGGGGLHYYLAYPENVERIRSRDLAPGLELKADGSFVVAPPSRTGEPA